MNFVNDIVTSYRNDLRIGRKEQYSQSDLIEGAKIVLTAIGLAKLMLSLGAMAAGLLGALASFAMRCNASSGNGIS